MVGSWLSLSSLEPHWWESCSMFAGRLCHLARRFLFSLVVDCGWEGKGPGGGI